MNATRKGQSLLAQVHEGMAVYDSTDQKIGTVADMYMGPSLDNQGNAAVEDTAPSSDNSANSENPIAAGAGLSIIPVPIGLGSSGTMVGAVLPGYAFEGELPAPIRSQLMASGFIRLHWAKVLGAVRYVMADQIETIQDDTVHLNTAQDQLIKQ